MTGALVRPGQPPAPGEPAAPGPPGRPGQPPAFDICGPLPSGVTLLEASAGTGKTFTIAALVTRYVAAGVGLDRLLVVTFTRMATGELRERVRERLLTAEEGLTRTMAGAPAPAGDEIVALLADGSLDEVALRRDRRGRRRGARHHAGARRHRPARRGRRRPVRPALLAPRQDAHVSPRGRPQ